MALREEAVLFLFGLSVVSVIYHAIELSDKISNSFV